MTQRISGTWTLTQKHERNVRQSKLAGKGDGNTESDLEKPLAPRASLCASGSWPKEPTLPPSFLPLL